MFNNWSVAVVESASTANREFTIPGLILKNFHEPNAYFITLTIDDKSYSELSNTYNITDDNEIGTKAIRLCLERIRKQTSKSIKHWFITELGHEKTERLHLHGIVWGIGTDKLITNKWNYGITFTGFFVNEPNVEEANEDDLLKLLGGDTLKINVKNTDDNYVEYTPVIVTANIVTGKQIGRASCRERV